jgi:chromosome segregation ATPase
MGQMTFVLDSTRKSKNSAKAELGGPAFGISGSSFVEHLRTEKSKETAKSSDRDNLSREIAKLQEEYNTLDEKDNAFISTRNAKKRQLNNLNRRLLESGGGEVTIGAYYHS